ncbi:MAG: hypothetical protein ACYC64_02035 [Armatimonadota bacterium]
MKRMRYLSMVMTIIILCTSAYAAGEFSMWFGDVSGSDIYVINAPNNETCEIYVWMSSTVSTWYAGAAIGFDRASSAGTTATPIDGKIVLASGVPGTDLSWGTALGFYSMEISRAVGGFYQAAGGTRPYGADFACANMSGTTGPITRTNIAKLRLRSHLASDGTYQIILWNDGGNTAGGLNTLVFGANPYYGVSDTLQVSGASNPVVGASNKSVMDAIMSSASAKYIWALWGKTKVIDSDSFYIDDGSGVNIKVVASSHHVIDGQYVTVRGTLDAATKTLTSQQITGYN